MHLSPQQALLALSESSSPFLEVFNHGTLNVEVYKPVGYDYQQPHNRDEVYVVISGTGSFRLEEKVSAFGPGDFLFVPAGAVHRFEDFSADFATWVLFYGPVGGEKNELHNNL